MIVGIGIDLVRISRIRDVITEWGDPFLNRVFMPIEVADCSHRKFPYIHFAGKFALKEAALKALGIGFCFGIHLKEIIITHDSFGAPLVTISIRLQELSGQDKISHVFASITHEDDYAIGQIILSNTN